MREHITSSVCRCNSVVRNLVILHKYMHTSPGQCYISACIRAVASFPSVSLRIINHTRMLRSILEDTAHGVVLSYPHSRVPHSPIHIRWLYAFYAFIFPVQDIFSHPPGRKSGRGVPVPRQKNIECAILV